MAETPEKVVAERLQRMRDDSPEGVIGEPPSQRRVTVPAPGRKGGTFISFEGIKPATPRPKTS